PESHIVGPYGKSATVDVEHTLAAAATQCEPAANIHNAAVYGQRSVSAIGSRQPQFRTCVHVAGIDDNAARRGAAGLDSGSSSIGGVYRATVNRKQTIETCDVSGGDLRGNIV